ncbi:MAG: bifunctional 5,10-methylenetetrahydrofolate dehydrogenase/5,10-methenyltetrahydrofolate cyclohydrolase [bacterium]|nr:bifunctional 5,10-methylenetetrahydrofolate dehydrogenase/5,10-methenyltetrahydrofolate cyclohydrolase [bacterium]
MQKISGQEVSGEIIERLRALPKPKGILAAVVVGQDPTSDSFLRQKEKVAQTLGVDFRRYQFQADTDNDTLRKEVGKLSTSKSIGGIIVQLPLPEGLNKHYVINAISREKDTDVLGERALGAFYNGRNRVCPPAVETVKEIIERQSVNLGQSKVAVVGLGALVGKPIALWLMGQCKEIYLMDKGSDLADLKNANLVISGVGKANLIKSELLKEGAGVIDFGYYYFEDGRLAGDLDMSSDLEKLSFYTPTPGGTGPILVAKLIENFYKLNEDV